MVKSTFWLARNVMVMKQTCEKEGGCTRGFGILAASDINLSCLLIKFNKGETLLTALYDIQYFIHHWLVKF